MHVTAVVTTLRSYHLFDPSIDYMAALLQTGIETISKKLWTKGFVFLPVIGDHFSLRRTAFPPPTPFSVRTMTEKDISCIGSICSISYSLF